MKKAIRCLLFAAVVVASLSAATIAEKTAGMEKVPGYFTYYWDAKAGKIWLEIDAGDSEFLYVDSMPAGMGSNDIGLGPRTTGRRSHIVKFTRYRTQGAAGPAELHVPRQSSDSADERRAVEQSFSQSVICGIRRGRRKMAAARPGGRHGVLSARCPRHSAAAHAPRRPAAAESSAWTRPVAPFICRAPRISRRTPKWKRRLPSQSDEPGFLVRSVAPTPGAITVREHHSFFELPGPGFHMREADPRAGFFGMRYMDYSAPVADPVVKRFAARHRLQKKDPSAAMSDPVKPIVYYLDRGTPEPIRSALLEGARWWNQAFTAAGYRDAFRVEMLPEDADPMDARYNIIQWVHRSTRGWSYGASVSDPRTGEIIKGHVTLGSLRVRQDYLIAEGLVADYQAGKPVSPAMLQMSLARLRQLAAHEVGHTLGLPHNYIASTEGRASVMDYPPPTVKLSASGEIDLSDAYAVGIGEWDKVSITWGYSDFPPGTNERKALDDILDQARARGLIFLTDQDARPPGSAHPSTHLWDSGTNAVDELDRLLKVRATALARFGERNIREHQPMATLEEVLVPVYLYHRYQTEAVSKVLGGQDYRYALKGDGQVPTAIVAAAEQRRALDALLRTIKPETLRLPESIIKLIPPHPSGYERTREDFRLHTGMTFDPLAAAETAAHQTIGLMLNPERAARLVEYHARDAKNPGLDEVLGRLLAATWEAPRAASSFDAAIQDVVKDVALYHLMMLAANEQASTGARAGAWSALEKLKASLTNQKAAARPFDGQVIEALARIKKFQDDPRTANLPKPLEPPDGQPIGSDEDWDCGWLPFDVPL